MFSLEYICLKKKKTVSINVSLLYSQLPVVERKQKVRILKMHCSDMERAKDQYAINYNHNNCSIPLETDGGRSGGGKGLKTLQMFCLEEQ